MGRAHIWQRWRSRDGVGHKFGARELERLSRIATKRRYPPDGVVFFQDDPSDSLYLILSGSVKVYHKSEDGRERILGVLGPMEIVGELALLDGEPRSATVSTLTDTEMLVISRRDFQALVAENPDLLWRVVEEVCERLRHSSVEIVDLSFRDLPSRLLRALSQLCAEHGTETREGCRIDLPITASDLAGMIGSKREQVSQLLSYFQDEGLVRLEPDHLVVPDPKVLDVASQYIKDRW